MTMSELENLRPIIGTSLIRVRRIFHVFDGEVDRSEGSVELKFSSGQIVLGEVGPAGDSMRISYEEWEDIFAEPLSPENRAFVASAGKDAAFDVSGEAPFDKLIGGRVMEVCEIAGASGKCMGYVFDVQGEMLVIWVNSDETFATVLP